MDAEQAAGTDLLNEQKNSAEHYKAKHDATSSPQTDWSVTESRERLSDANPSFSTSE